MKELKPCPFCGGVAEVLWHEPDATKGGKTVYTLCCRNCRILLGKLRVNPDGGLGVEGFPTVLKSITAWNKRASLK